MHAFVWLVLFVALLWVIAVVNAVAGLDLQQYGILPRSQTGLRGIPLHVFLHGDFRHLISNSAPILMLGGFVSLRGSRKLLGLSFFVIMFAGGCVWLVAREGVHIGASGLVFGYFGYLVARGFYERSISSILVAIVVVFFYWGIIFGILPTGEFVSWEGHFFGLLGGIAYAYRDGRSRR